MTFLTHALKRLEAKRDIADVYDSFHKLYKGRRWPMTILQRQVPQQLAAYVIIRSLMIPLVQRNAGEVGFNEMGALAGIRWTAHNIALFMELNERRVLYTNADVQTLDYLAAQYSHTILFPDTTLLDITTINAIPTHTHWAEEALHCIYEIQQPLPIRGEAPVTLSRFPTPVTVHIYPTPMTRRDPLFSVYKIFSREDQKFLKKILGKYGDTSLTSMFGAALHGHYRDQKRLAARLRSVHKWLQRVLWPTIALLILKNPMSISRIAAMFPDASIATTPMDLDRVLDKITGTKAATKMHAMMAALWERLDGCVPRTRTLLDALHEYIPLRRFINVALSRENAFFGTKSRLFRLFDMAHSTRGLGPKIQPIHNQLILAVFGLRMGFHLYLDIGPGAPTTAIGFLTWPDETITEFLERAYRTVSEAFPMIFDRDISDLVNPLDRIAALDDVGRAIKCEFSAAVLGQVQALHTHVTTGDGNFTDTTLAFMSEVYDHLILRMPLLERRTPVEISDGPIQEDAALTPYDLSELFLTLFRLMRSRWMRDPIPLEGLQYESPENAINGRFVMEGKTKLKVRGNRTDWLSLCIYMDVPELMHIVARKVVFQHRTLPDVPFYRTPEFLEAYLTIAVFPAALLTKLGNILIGPRIYATLPILYNLVKKAAAAAIFREILPEWTPPKTRKSVTYEVYSSRRALLRWFIDACICLTYLDGPPIAYPTAEELEADGVPTDHYVMGFPHRQNKQWLSPRHPAHFDTKQVLIVNIGTRQAYIFEAFASAALHRFIHRAAHAFLLPHTLTQARSTTRKRHKTELLDDRSRDDLRDSIQIAADALASVVFWARKVDTNVLFKASASALQRWIRVVMRLGLLPKEFDPITEGQRLAGGRLRGAGRAGEDVAMTALRSAHRSADDALHTIRDILVYTLRRHTVHNADIFTPILRVLMGTLFSHVLEDRRLQVSDEEFLQLMHGVEGVGTRARVEARLEGEMGMFASYVPIVQLAIFSAGPDTTGPDATTAFRAFVNSLIRDQRVILAGSTMSIRERLVRTLAKRAISGDC